MSILEFDEIYKKYEREIYGFIFMIARKDRFYTEDILQNTMINAYKYLYTLKSKDKVKSWLLSIARKEAKRYFYKESNYMSSNTNYSDNILEFDHDELTEPDFSVEFIDNESFVKLISLLSEEEQSILFLKYSYDMTLSEIAETWGMNRNTLKSIHLRAIKKLKSMIIEKEY